MWAIISSIYRAYCYARLLEMRRNHCEGEERRPARLNTPADLQLVGDHGTGSER